MSQIVLGLGTSHSPLLTFDVDTWIEKAADDMRRRLNLSDGRFVTYAELLAEFGKCRTAAAERDHLEMQRLQCQRNLDRLADALEEARPDIVVVVGDDQAELFSMTSMPALSVFYGDQVIMHPWENTDGTMPGWKLAAATGYGMDRARVYRGAPDIGLRMIEGLIARGFDVGAASEVVDPQVAGFGHAFGFIAERLFRGRQYPMLPILLNTYFRPNVPTAGRCHEIGRAVREILQSLGNLRIAVIASGGLSHFVTDEILDRGFFTALQTGDIGYLRSIPPEALRSGSSEILNWILAAGVLENLRVEWNDYLPVYRTPAGTGIGMGFMIWR